MMRYLAFIFILLFPFFKSSASSLTHCQSLPFKIEGNTIILPGTDNPKAPVIYFFKNKSLQSVWIDHPIAKNPGVSAGWSSYLRSSHWSALVLNKKNFAVSCVMIQPGKVVPLHCASILDVCTPSHMTTKTPLKGNYWLAEDKPWESFLKAIEKRGVIISDHS